MLYYVRRTLILIGMARRDTRTRPRISARDMAPCADCPSALEIDLMMNCYRNIPLLLIHSILRSVFLFPKRLHPYAYQSLSIDVHEEFYADAAAAAQTAKQCAHISITTHHCAMHTLSSAAEIIFQSSHGISLPRRPRVQVPDPFVGQELTLGARAILHSRRDTEVYV